MKICKYFDSGVLPPFELTDAAVRFDLRPGQKILNVLIFLLFRWRRGGQGQTVQPHSDTEDRAQPEGIHYPSRLARQLLQFRRRRHGVDVEEPLADPDPDCDSPDGSPEPDLAELTVAVGEVVKGERIRERQGRRVDH